MATQGCIQSKELNELVADPDFCCVTFPTTFSLYKIPIQTTSTSF